MLLSISTTHQPATDLGYLLHKHPDRFQSFDLSFGEAHVFYPEMTEHSATAVLVLDVDPVGMIRDGHLAKSSGSPLANYVNDRPYVASSFMSVAISQVFGTAMGGRCVQRPELVSQPLPLTARIDVLPVRLAPGMVERMFEPLGYRVTAKRLPLDEQFPAWGDSPYYSVELSGTVTLAQLLTHLYVLIPVFDNEKHYYVADDELEKLLAKGAGWLAAHPERETIARRFLRFRSSLYRQAIRRLDEESDPRPESEEAVPQEAPETELELSLNQQRYVAVLEALRSSGAASVLDLGCGEGKFLRELVRERRFKRIVGVDVSMAALENAQQRLRIETLSSTPSETERVSLMQGSLMYRDARLADFDAAAVVEVIEHLEPSRLAGLERSIFEFARPQTVALTTPNREYNVVWETLPSGQFRHGDHRFEWSRDEFQTWARRVAQTYGYQVRFEPIGPVDETLGSPTQMGVFERD